MSTPQPTVGRVVHFWPAGNERKGQPYPAIITHVWGPECVNLCVCSDGSFSATVSFLLPTSVMLSKGPDDRADKWEWPPVPCRLCNSLPCRCRGSLSGPLADGPCRKGT